MIYFTCVDYFRNCRYFFDDPTIDAAALDKFHLLAFATPSTSATSVNLTSLGPKVRPRL
jgi:hypothetical protein